LYLGDLDYPFFKIMHAWSFLNSINRLTCSAFVMNGRSLTEKKAPSLHTVSYGYNRKLFSENPSGILGFNNTQNGALGSECWLVRQLQY
jgi:hypothetical protein